MTPIPVSVVVMTRNEAANIARCLAALHRFAEVMVVDSASDDGTAAIAASAGARVVAFNWDGRYPKKKEWCRRHLALANRWLLYVDADEIVTPALAEEIAVLMRHGPRAAGYMIEGRYVVDGRVLGFGLRNAKLALIDRHRAVFPTCDDLAVPGGWEVEGHYQPALDGPVGRLKAPMQHDDRKPFSTWVARHECYAAWEADLRQRGARLAVERHECRRRRWVKRLVHHLPFRPLAAFLHCYVLRLGFLDGGAGFRFAVSRAFYYWLIGMTERRAAADKRRGIEAETIPAHRPDGHQQSG